MPKVLISDSMSSVAQKIFEKNNIQFDVKTGLSEEEIIKFCRETLAGFKLPKKVVFSSLPKTSTGKIQKFELRKKAKELN